MVPSATISTETTRSDIGTARMRKRSNAKRNLQYFQVLFDNPYNYYFKH